MENSKIEWTKHTANLWIGCTEVHAGCDNCYARVLNNRWGHKNWGNDAPRRTVQKVWNDFKKWQSAAAKLGEIHNVFVGSMMDIFEKPMPVVDGKGNRIYVDDMDEEGMTTEDLRAQFFGLVVPKSPNLRFLLLTKRPSNINRFIPESWKTTPPTNVMFGTSPVNQETADRLIPQLLEVNGKHFLSVEPMLDKVNLTKWLWKPCPGCGGSGSLPVPGGGNACPDCLDHQAEVPAGYINWVIVGGESGHGKREFNPKWAKEVMTDCKIAKVPFFMKQWDKIKAIPEDLMIREFPTV